MDREITASKNRHYAIYLTGAGAVLTALLLLLASLLSERTAVGGLAAVTAAVRFVCEAVTGSPLSAGTTCLLERLAGPACLAVGYGLLSLLIWTASRLRDSQPAAVARPTLLALGGAWSWAALNRLLLPPLTGRALDLPGWLWAGAGALCAAGGLALFFWLLRRFPRVVNRETVSYVVFGALTTLVNIAVYLAAAAAFGSSQALLTTLNNSIAWVVSVLFAYVVNKLFVFQSRTGSRKAALREFGLFVGARIFSYVVDVACMVLMVNVIHVNEAAAKVAANVVVMVMNYFFSRWIIFRQKGTDSEKGNEGSV